MLYIAHDVSAPLGQVIRSVPGPVLIVTEAQGALERGSILNFVISDGRVRFEAAIGPAQRRGLRLSSRMLSVAINVRSGTMLPASMEYLAAARAPMRWLP